MPARLDGPRSPGEIYAVLGIGVCAVSVAAPIIKEIHAPSLTIAAYRLVFASIPVAALLLWRARSELGRLSSSDLRSIVLAGLSLAAHFATWIASLQFGTVASSVALVTTSPLFVAGFAFFVARERTSRAMLLAIAISVSGGVIIAAADFRGGGLEPLGDGLALAGAVFAAAYYAFGRRVRGRVSLVSYVGLVYPVSAVALTLLATGARQPMTGLSLRAVVLLVALALIPQIVGHSALNWSLRYLSAPSVAIAVLGEPVIATVLAAALLREMPGWARVAGGALILLGVYLALREERTRGPAYVLSGEASA
jgi:drug/metabolite transporter (DMT)-like permease